MAFRFLPTSGFRAETPVFAIAVNVQPLYAIAAGPIRPAALWTIALMPGVDLHRDLGRDEFASVGRLCAVFDGIEQ